jgi:hypothetical protein
MAGTKTKQSQIKPGGCGMERVQSNGGTSGTIAAICLVLLFILFASSGLDPQSARDPAKALPLLGQKAGVFAAVGVLGLLASGFGLIFTFGLFVRLREKAPTRAVANLGLGFVGLTMHALGAALLWQGGALLVSLSAKDQTAASHAWIAVGAVNQALMATGNGFTGGAVLMAGWAIVATGAMNTTLGWVAVIAGVVEILQVFSSQMALMGLGFLLVIIWLVWGGAQLRRAPA